MNPEVRPPKRSEVVAQHLRRKIVLRELREGQAIPNESQLVKQYGVSRPTLREAMRILESEGLLTVTPGSHDGARVHPPNGRKAAHYAGLVLQYRGVTLQDVFEARAVFESPVAGLVAERADAALLEALTENVASASQVGQDPETVNRLGVEFHRMLVHGAGIGTLSFLSDMVHDIIERAGRMRTRMEADKPPERRANQLALRVHSKLVDFIAAGKASEATELWQRHLLEGGAYVMDGIGGSSVVDLVEREGLWNV